MRVISSFCFKLISSLSHSDLEMIVRNALPIMTGGHEAVYGTDACTSVDGVFVEGNSIPNGALDLFLEKSKLFVLSMEPGYGEWYLTRQKGFLIFRCVDNSRRGFTRKISIKNSRKCETSKIRLHQFQSFRNNGLMDVCFDNLNGYALGNEKFIFSCALALNYQWESPNLDCFDNILKIFASNSELAKQKNDLILDEKGINNLLNEICKKASKNSKISQGFLAENCLVSVNNYPFKFSD